MPSKRKVDNESDETRTKCYQDESDEIAGKSTATYRFLFSTRFLISILVLFGVFMQYAAKLDLSVNIVCMVNHTASSMNSSYVRKVNDNECPGSNSTSMDGPFLWTRFQESNLLAAFFYGYLISEVPGGIMASKFGAKKTMGVAVAINAIAAFHYGAAALNNYGIIFFLRVLVGFACGMMLPSVAHIWTRWAPTHERSLLIGIAMSGAHLAPIMMLPLGGYLCQFPFTSHNWQSIFYVVAIMQSLWLIFWALLFTDVPEDHRFINLEEQRFIDDTVELNGLDHNMTVPWKAILTSRACWALFMTHTFSNWGFYTLLTEIPSYLKQVLKFDIKSNGLNAAIPYIVIWVSTTGSSYIADMLMLKGIFTRTTVRKIAVGIATFTPAAFLIALGFMKCTQRTEAVALLAVGQGLFGVGWGAGHMCVANDIAPLHAGVVFGISNTFATLPGIITPYVTGAITYDGTQSQWLIVFIISAVFLIMGGVTFILFGSGDAQEWDSSHVVQPHRRSISSIQ